MKKCIFVLLIIVLGSSYAFSQGFAVDKGAMIVSGMASFISHKVKDAENSTTIISAMPMVQYFLAPNIFIGGLAEFESMSHGDYSSSSLGIGPTVGYAIGNSNSSTFPYLRGAYIFGSSSEDDGVNEAKATDSDITIAVGLIAAVKDHIGIIIEGGYHILSDKPDGADESLSSSAIVVSVGVSGLLY